MHRQAPSQARDEFANHYTRNFYGPYSTGRLGYRSVKTFFLKYYLLAFWPPYLTYPYGRPIIQIDFFAFLMVDWESLEKFSWEHAQKPDKMSKIRFDIPSFLAFKTEWVLEGIFEKKIFKGIWIYYQKSKNFIWKHWHPIGKGLTNYLANIHLKNFHWLITMSVPVESRL